MWQLHALLDDASLTATIQESNEDSIRTLTAEQATVLCAVCAVPSLEHCVLGAARVRVKQRCSE